MKKRKPPASEAERFAQHVEMARVLREALDGINTDFMNKLELLTPGEAFE
jgi:hypothetical protein